MGLIAYQQSLPAPPTSAINPDGSLSKEFRYLLLSLLSRTGGPPGVANGNVPSGQQNGITVAAGATFNIIGDWNEFATVGAGAVAQLPAMAVGTDCIVWNDGASALLIKPQANVQIDALAAGVGYSLPVGTMQWFRVISTTQIKSSIFATALLTTTTYTVANLPAANSVLVGSRAFVTDANTTLTLGIGTAVVGLGANKVPVFSDGTNWIIG